jgi:hypothetical protein
MVQLAGGVTAVQLSVVPVLLVSLAARPVGTLDMAVQTGAALVVTLTGGVLLAELPAASLASTAKL